MIRKMLLVAVMLGATTVAAAATPSDANGPTLAITKGTVMVNNGSQFVTAKPGQVLKPGDRVMVMQGASATLNYGNGHAAKLSPGTMADVSASSATTYGSAKKVGPMYAQAVGDRNSNSNDDNDNNNEAALYSALIGGTALAIIFNASHSNRPSISAP